MEARNQNINLWIKKINHRDNVSTSIGFYIRLPCPFLIDQYMLCDIPMVKPYAPSILLKHFPKVHTLPINDKLKQTPP